MAQCINPACCRLSASSHTCTHTLTFTHKPPSTECTQISHRDKTSCSPVLRVEGVASVIHAQVLHMLSHTGN